LSSPPWCCSLGVEQGQAAMSAHSTRTMAVEQSRRDSLVSCASEVTEDGRNFMGHFTFCNGLENTCDRTIEQESTVLDNSVTLSDGGPLDRDDPRMQSLVRKCVPKPLQRAARRSCMRQGRDDSLFRADLGPATGFASRQPSSHVQSQPALSAQCHSPPVIRTCSSVGPNHSFSPPTSSQAATTSHSPASIRAATPVKHVPCSFPPVVTRSPSYRGHEQPGMSTPSTPRSFRGPATTVTVKPPTQVRARTATPASPRGVRAEDALQKTRMTLHCKPVEGCSPDVLQMTRPVLQCVAVSPDRAHLSRTCASMPVLTPRSPCDDRRATSPVPQGRNVDARRTLSWKAVAPESPRQTTPRAPGPCSSARICSPPHSAYAHVQRRVIPTTYAHVESATKKPFPFSQAMTWSPQPVSPRQPQQRAVSPAPTPRSAHRFSSPRASPRSNYAHVQQSVAAPASMLKGSGKCILPKHSEHDRDRFVAYAKLRGGGC